MLKIGQFTRLAARQLIHQKVITNLRVTTVKFSSRNFASENNSNDNEIHLKKLIAAQDPDSFGTLSPNVTTADDDFKEEGDIKEEKFLSEKPRRALSRKEYADLIKDHLRHRRVREAIDVLEVKMLQEDRAKPVNYIYNLLIDGCAREGYTKKAFNLFTRMRQRGLKATGSTYTSLFNACANGPYASSALPQATRLREIMIEKGYEPNEQTYNAMIKCYGRLNDLKTAFAIADEMDQKFVKIHTETFNFLLQACITDKEFGFRHALLVWHKMLHRRIWPDIYSFNLMLRTCRDCQLGDLETTEEVLQTILLRGSDDQPNQLTIESHENSEKPSEIEIQSPRVNIESIPNLLALRPHIGNMVSMAEVSKPEDKLLLIGGFSGFLDTMKSFDVRPNLITFTELLEVIPPTTAAEQRLMQQIKKNEIKCDVDFFNVLMKKRCLRYEYDEAREVLGMIEKVKLQPDIVTYGVLALSCQTHEEAKQLIHEMNERGIKMNIQILGAMFKNACMKHNFDYALEVLRIVRDLQIKPSAKLLETLDTAIKICNKLAKRDVKFSSFEFREDLRKFKNKVGKWKSDMGMNKMSLEEMKQVVKEKPWEQFQTPQAEGFEDTKGLKKRRAQKYKRFIGLIKHKPVDDDKEKPQSS